MNNKRASMITWAVVIALLVGGAILSATWSQISAQLPAFELGGISLGGGPSAPPAESERIRLDFLPIEALNDVELSEFAAMGIMAVLVIGPVVVAGGGLAFLYRLLDRMASQTKEEETFQKLQSELEKKEQARLKERRQAQPANPIPNHERPRWSAVSTALIVIVFFVYLGNALTDAFVPGGRIVEGDAILNITQIVVLSLIALAAIVSVVALRPQTMSNVDRSENMPIPWGMIWVVVSGLLMLGVGTGIMLALSG